ncbi:hypothetical protein AN958_10548 [Leucoagaricus sp. SymC.cos]|nr:hypothetical protein AN958_10548 [Leucoagaricus sp. SymC.cos]
MALQENDDFVPSISVEAPPDDPYGLIQSTTNSADDDDFLRDATAADYFKDALFSSSLYSPTSPSSDGYLPSSPESLYSLTSSLDSPWYSPQGSPYQLSATESPYPTSLDDFPDFAPPTVAPRDITSSTFDSSFLDASAVHEGAAHSMEPLFEEGFEDAQDQDLVALDGLDSHGTMSSTLFSPEVTDLRISIPVTAPSSRPPSPVPHYSPVPLSGISEAPKAPGPDKPSRSPDRPDIPSQASEASYSNSSPSSSSTPPGLLFELRRHQGAFHLDVIPTRGSCQIRNTPPPRRKRR